MQGIANIAARIQSIQARIGQPRPDGEFGSVLTAKMGDGAERAPKATIDDASGHEHDALDVGVAALDARVFNTRAGVTLGTMITGSPHVGPISGPSSPLVHHVPDGSIVTAGELADYVAANQIEARNGRLDNSELTTISGSWYGDGRLLAPAAEAWELMRAAAAEDGIDLKAIDTYRSWESQERAYRKHLSGEKKANVLPPGTSRHGAGLAIDVTNGSIIDRGDQEWRWLDANARSFGWHPISNETWHWEFRGA